MLPQCSETPIDMFVSLGDLKELHHHILSHFFNVLNRGSSVGKAKNNGVLRKKNTIGLTLKQTGTRIEKIETDWK